MASPLVGPTARASAVWCFYLGGLCAGCASALPIASSDGGLAASDLGTPVDLLEPHDSDTVAALHDLASVPDLATPRDLAPPPDLTPPADLATPPDLGPFPPGAVFQVSSKATGQLLSIHNSATTNGAITEEQPARNTPDQRWLVQAAASGTYAIVNDGSQTCLDVNAGSTADGATTWIWSCNSGASQRWTLKDAGGGFYSLVNVNSQSCLDLDHGNSAPGTVIFQFHCNGGDNQKWLFTRVQ